MKIYKHKSFHQWAKSEGLTDDLLKQAVEEMNAGLYEANLGSGLYKKRIAMKGKGKRGGYRVLLAFKQESQESRSFYVYGFAKKDKANINEKEKGVYRDLAKVLLNADEKILAKMIKQGSLIEVI